MLTIGCSLRRGQPRAPYCMMGVCFGCELTIDDKPGVRACMTRVRPGMRIDTGELE
ncbi:(2Fe-2S)-binding protein [Oceanimonas sp. NS1]|nr:(2Fe-2S)-binding protein [Oceanimonas sp. NS1]